MAQLRRQKTTLETGFVAIEPGTGAVKAWVGSRDWDLDKFDHVQQAHRQAGSTFKPFVYGAAFEEGMQPWDTIMDTPTDIQIDRNKTWRPTDIEDATNQPMTLRDALAHSRNTVTAQLMMRVGPSRVASVARALGVRESKLDEVPSLALGTSPVTLKEMVTAFSSIANGGSYVEPQIVTAVEDRDHNVLESFAPSAPQQGLEHEAASTLLDVMRSVVDYGTAASLRPRFGLSGDLAGKTGTTQDNKDGWFIAMHPQLVAGAWVGFNDNRVAMRSSYWGQGAHNALLLVGDFLQHSEKAGVIDAKATFAAPHLKAPEPTLQEKMGDWWASVFNTAPSSGSETAAVAGPDVQVEQPQLEPAPESITVPPPAPLPYPAPAPTPAITPDAPVIASEPQRVPAFPRPLESARPADTIPGTHVYEAPQTASRNVDAQAQADTNADANTDVASGDRRSRTRPARSSGTAVYTPVPLTSEMGAPAGSRSERAASPADSDRGRAQRSGSSRRDGAARGRGDMYRDDSDYGSDGTSSYGGRRGAGSAGSRSDSDGSGRADSDGSSRSDTYGSSRSDGYDSGRADSSGGRRGDTYDFERADAPRSRARLADGSRPRGGADRDTFSDDDTASSAVTPRPRHRDAASATGAYGGSPIPEIAPAYEDGDE
jgi:membrane peptidoglycan carboxypeptidase